MTKAEWESAFRAAAKTYGEMVTAAVRDLVARHAALYGAGTNKPNGILHKEGNAET